MSEPSKKALKAKAITEMPDDKAIRKLFPKEVVEEVNRIIGHAPKSAPPKKR